LTKISIELGAPLFYETRCIYYADIDMYATLYVYFKST